MISIRVRAKLALIPGLFVLYVSGPPALAEEAPKAVVRKITDQVIAVLRDKELDADQKRTKIEDIVYDHVDFRTMSRLVLARNWSTLEREQQEQFVDEFRKHLSITYGSNVENYQNETVEITGAREEARGDWTVKTQIVRDGPHDIFVDYRLREQSDGWKIIDVIIERVSLVSNFRSQFQDIMASGGFDRLIGLLRKKNATGTSGLKS